MLFPCGPGRKVTIEEGFWGYDDGSVGQMLALQAWGLRALAPRWEMLMWCHVLITLCREWRREDPGQCWPALLAYLETLGQWDPVSEQGGLLLLRNDMPGCPLTFTRDAERSHVHACTHGVPFLYFSFSLNASSVSPGNGCIFKHLNCKLTVFPPQCSGSFVLF